MAKKTFVFEQLKDLHVRNVVVFAKAADSKLYVDADFTTQLEEVELQELFKKGMLLVKVDDDEYAVPAHVKDNKAYIVSASTTAAVTEWAAKAVESVSKKKASK